MKISSYIVFIICLVYACKAPNNNTIDNAILLTNNETDSSFIKKWEQSNIASINKLVANERIEQSDKYLVDGLKKSISFYTNLPIEYNYRYHLLCNWIIPKYKQMQIDSLDDIYILEREYKRELNRFFIIAEHKVTLYLLEEEPTFLNKKRHIKEKYLTQLYKLSTQLKYNKEEFRNIETKERFLNITKIEQNKITSNVITYYTKEQFKEIEKILSKIDSVLNIKAGISLDVQ